MKEKQLKKQEVTEVPQDEQKVKHYDFGHLVIYCGKCNSKYILKEDVPGNEAVQVTLPPTNTAELRLVCKDCRNEMALFYVESSKKAEKKDESKNEASQPVEEDVKQEGESNESIPKESTDQKQSV